MTASQVHHDSQGMAGSGREMELIAPSQESVDDNIAEAKAVSDECIPLQDNAVKAINDEDLERCPEKRRPPFFVRLKTEAPFRHNLIQTALLCLSYGGYGWQIAALGPTLPDLQLLTGEGLSTQSWLFTLGSIGYLTGSLVGGFLYDRMCKTLFLAVSSAMLGLTLIVLPFCRQFALMLCVMALVGISEGMVDTGCNAHVVHVWRSETGAYIQAMHFVYSVEAMVAPLVTSLFLAEKTTVCSAVSSVVSNGTDSMYSVLNGSTRSIITDTTNQTMAPYEHCSETYEEIRVHYAFIISAVMSFIPAVGFAIVTYTKRTTDITVSAAAEVSTEEKAKRRRRTKFPKTIMIVLMTFVIIHGSLQNVLDDSFGRFFMTFFLGHLQWTKAKSSLAVFIFWLLHGLGNLMAIFFVSCCDGNLVLRIFVSLYGVSFLIFLLSSKFMIEPLIWASVGMVGFFMSVIIPGLITWISDNVTHVTGKVSALFMVTDGLAGFPFPPIIGGAMDNLGPMWFVYILGIIVLICIVMFLVAQILLRMATQRWTLSNSGDEMDIHVEVRTQMNEL